jgi:hypothetical protein
MPLLPCGSSLVAHLQVYQLLAVIALEDSSKEELPVFDKFGFGDL